VDAADVGKEKDERERGGEHQEGRGKGEVVAREGRRKRPSQSKRGGEVLGIMTQKVISHVWARCWWHGKCPRQG
jgi:hypothetical protein